MSAPAYEHGAEFAAHIRGTLAEHPDWLSHALSGVVAGTEDARERLNAVRAKSDAACLAALALLDTKRLTPELRDSLGKTICRAISPAPHQCELERRALEQWGEQ